MTASSVAVLGCAMENPYDILGIDRSATEAEIRAVYRKLAKRDHPDINPGIPEF